MDGIIIIINHTKQPIRIIKKMNESTNQQTNNKNKQTNNQPTTQTKIQKERLFSFETAFY